MLTPAEIKAQAERKYPDFVAAYFRGEVFFPHPVRFGQPAPSDTLGQLRRQIEELWHGSHEFTKHGYRIEFEERRMRLHGEQRLPSRVWFENAAEFLSFIGYTKAFSQLQEDVAEAMNVAPEIRGWVRANARVLIRNLTPGDGRALGLAIAALHRNPRPNCFSREIALPGVSGKFIEANLRLIGTILEEIGSPAFGPGDELHERLGLRTAPRMLRLMWLDGRYEDFGVSAARFERPEQLDNIIIVENLPSFLTLPPMPRTLAVFGEGRASQTLSQSKWLAGARIFYWGDADPYGFNILCALRSEFSAVQSILMNWDVWTKFPNCRAPTRIPHFKEATPDASWQVLTADELAAAQETIRNTFVKDGALHGHGIEQEKIPYLDASGAIIRALSLGITG